MKKSLVKACLFVLLFLTISTKVFSQPPVISPINGSTVICTPSPSGVSYSVSATNFPIAYYWSYSGPYNINLAQSSGGSVCTIVFPSLAAGATYTLYCYASNGAGNSQIASLVVKAFETPVVSFSGSQVMCQGSSTQLSASSTIFQASSTTLSYSWSPSTGLSSTNSYSVIANPTITTNYSVLVTNGPCMASNQVAVFVVPCIIGIPENKSETTHLEVYPNPNNGSFVISSSQNKTIFIRNELGQIVRTVDVEAGSENRVSGLSAGIYFILADDIRKKIIVAR